MTNFIYDPFDLIKLTIYPERLLHVSYELFVVYDLWRLSDIKMNEYKFLLLFKRSEIFH